MKTTVKQPSRMHFKAMVDAKNPRLQPPPELGAAQTLIWRQTVDALPSDWFAPEQAPLLSAYCGHVARLKQIEAALAGLHPLENLEQFDKLSKLAAGESAKILAHGRSMRLTQQSRLKAETAASRGLGAASAGQVADQADNPASEFFSRYFPQ